MKQNKINIDGSVWSHVLQVCCVLFPDLSHYATLVNCFQRDVQHWPLMSVFIRLAAAWSSSLNSDEDSKRLSVVSNWIYSQSQNELVSSQRSRSSAPRLSERGAQTSSHLRRAAGLILTFVLSYTCPKLKSIKMTRWSNLRHLREKWTNMAAQDKPWSGHVQQTLSWAEQLVSIFAVYFIISESLPSPSCCVGLYDRFSMNCHLQWTVKSAGLNFIFY